MAEQTTVDINLSSLEQLTDTPRIGPAIAQRIVDNRPYESVDDLVRVPGIGSNVLENMRPYLQVKNDLEEPLVDVQISSTTENEGSETVETVETEVFAPEELTPQELEENFEFEHQVYDQPASSTDPEDQEEKKEPEEKSEPVNSSEKFQTEGKDVSPEVVDVKPKPVQSVQENFITRSQLWWSVAGTAVITVFLTILITLGILSVMNGGLQYASTQRAYNLESSINTLGDRSDAIESNIEGLRTRLDTLETVAARVTKLEQTTENIQSALTETQDTLNTLSLTVEQMQQQIDLLQAASQKSLDFRNGLLDLLIQTDGMPVTEGK